MEDSIKKKRRSPFARRTDIDMTKGSIAGNILRFAFPLLLGNLFQQLYNVVDTWVIGQTGEGGAYSAVGSVGPIVNILIGFFSGLSAGAGVVISQYFGAKKHDKVKESVHTALIMTAGLGILFTFIGVTLTPWICKLMLGEDSITYPFAKEYLVIYFSGILGMMLYNVGAGILRAVGDSDRPFYFLVASALCNTALDLLFVFKLGWGVRGVAFATVIAQALSAVLAMATLFTTDSTVRVRLRDLKVNFSILGKIVWVGLPAALQMALTAFSNVFVQSYISGVNGTKIEQMSALGGWTTYSKVDAFLFLPMQSLALAVTTFVGQNVGIRDFKRARKGTYITYAMANVITALLILIIELFAPAFARFFNADPLIVENSTLLLHYITPFYIFCCVNQIFTASMRGMGKSVPPMIIMLACFVGMRQAYLFVMPNYISNDLIPIALGYPFGWGCCCLSTLVYYFTRGNKNIRSLVEQKAD
ncbi:MAG: MATE family efflux transporter [Clostridia bacterium]|nr:MATE family efflux transporter [Clostridia bacterium]